MKKSRILRALKKYDAKTFDKNRVLSFKDEKNKSKIVKAVISMNI